MMYTLYMPNESRREIEADTDKRAMIAARRILRTRGKWTFLADLDGERCVQAWNLDPPSYGERSRVAILAAPIEPDDREARELARADYDVE